MTPYFPRVPLTTRQPAEYSWMLGNRTLLTKIGQSLLCTRSSTQSTTCPKQFTTTTPGLHASKMTTWAHASILTKIHINYITIVQELITSLLIQHILKSRILIHVLQKDNKATIRLSYHNRPLVSAVFPIAPCT